MSTAKDHKLGLLMVALLAGASVRLDEIYYRNPLLEELWPDWLIGLILAFAATVVSGADALVTTQLGLVMVIPGLLLLAYIRHRYRSLNA